MYLEIPIVYPWAWSLRGVTGRFRGRKSKARAAGMGFASKNERITEVSRG